MPKTQAIWDGKVIAASDNCINVEGNAYFPPQDLNTEFLRPNTHTSICSWKGDATYFDIVVDGKTKANAAWVYNNPRAAAAAIKGYVAFWKGVEVKGAENARAMAA